MITCRHAHQLFDRYLDGELSSSLQAELHAHQLACSSCRSDLALLEACGDVVAGDRREPVLGEAFTERVMQAYRMQQRPVRRSWGRVLVLFGSPAAAAASIVLAVTMIAPTAPPRTGREGITAGREVAVSAAVQGMQIPTRQLTARDREALARTPKMEAAGIVEKLVGPLVEQTWKSIEQTRRGARQLEYLVRLGPGAGTERLAAGSPPAEAGQPAGGGRSDLPWYQEWNLLVPPLDFDAPPVPPAHSDVDAELETL